MSFGFPLLSDEGRKVAAQYDAVKVGGLAVKRTVVIVDAEGRIRYIKAGMPPDSELLDAIRGFGG